MAASILSRRSGFVIETLSFSLKAVCPRLSIVGGGLQQNASYHARPSRLKDGPYIPDKENEKTPIWQKTAKYDRKLFGRYGSASGIDPAILWPSRQQLEEIIAEEKQWHPTLEELLHNVAVEEKELADKRLAREKLIAANMAKMPKMIADWRREKREAKVKKREEKAKRDRLLAEARERFGYAMDPRSPKFQELLAEIEKEERKKKKLLKRRRREEEQNLGTPPSEGTESTKATS